MNYEAMDLGQLMTEWTELENAMDLPGLPVVEQEAICAEITRIETILKTKYNYNPLNDKEDYPL